MPKISKRFKKASEGLTAESNFDLTAAVKLLKEKASAKFDETERINNINSLFNIKVLYLLMAPTIENGTRID